MEREHILGVVAHDLRAPLNAIGLSVDVVSRGLEHKASAETMRRPLDAICRSVTRMDRLIEDLLDLSRIDAGRGEPGKGSEFSFTLTLVA